MRRCASSRAPSSRRTRSTSIPRPRAPRATPTSSRRRPSRSSCRSTRSRKLLADPDAGIDFSRVVHGDQRFTSTRPIVAGDELTATLTVSSVKSLGAHSMVTAESSITDAVGRARRHRDLDARRARRRMMAAATVTRPRLRRARRRRRRRRAQFPLTRDSLVRYAGASGDFNPIHYRDDVAAVGRAARRARARHAHHGLRRAAGRRLGGRPRPRRRLPGAVHPPGASSTPSRARLVTVVAKVGQLDEAATVARIDLTVKFDDETVLGKAQVRVALG